MLDTHWPRLFGIADDHVLTLASECRSENVRAQRCTRWFVERDADARIVARYRSWTSRARQAPWRDQLGWERYAPDGALLVREVRYACAKRAASEPGGWLN